jgi:hypothetical protein
MLGGLKMSTLISWWPMGALFLFCAYSVVKQREGLKRQGQVFEFARATESAAVERYETGIEIQRAAIEDQKQVLETLRELLELARDRNRQGERIIALLEKRAEIT